MIQAVVTDPSSGQPVVVASLERERLKLEKEIQDACSEFLSEPDWDKNMQIVDKLNRAPYLCPFAVKEIRKQLKTKNPEIEILALQLTETLIKNCPSSHAAVAQEDFMRYLVKVGKNQRADGKLKSFKKKITFSSKPKINSAHVRSQCIERALLILKMLGMAYAESQLYPVFKATYKRLKQENVRFPETNKDESLEVFSPMHSSAAPNEFSNQPQYSAMGSIPKSQQPSNINNAHLEMIRPFIPVENVTDPVLVQAQENAHLLFEMINAPQLSFELIPELIAMLQNQQQRVVVLISEGNAPDQILAQALQMNDVCNTVLEDAFAIQSGTKRRYQEKIQMAKLFKQDSNSLQKKKKQKHESKDDDDDDEPSLEHSISIPENDKNTDPALFALTAPQNEKLSKKRGSKKSKRQSIDLLGMEENNADIMNQLNGNNPQQKKQESEEDLMGFLGIKPTEQPSKKSNEPPKPTIFDPLEDDTSNKPPPAYSSPAPIINNNNNNNNIINPITRGNNSVLDVLTKGESSPYQSSGGSSLQQSTKNSPPKPTQNNYQKKEIDTFDTGTDPFAEMNNDPFADMKGAAFDDPNTSKKQPQPQPQQQQQYKSQSQPKPKANNNDADPFKDFTGNGFDDDAALNVVSNNKPKPKPQPKPPQKVDSNNIILDMFSAGASPDPNSPRTQNRMMKEAQKQKQILKPKPKKEDNPFDSLANPFDQSGGNVQSDNNDDDDNPFNNLDDPFASTGDADDDNPFAAFAGTNNNNNNNNNQKKEDFMADRDPFADM